MKKKHTVVSDCMMMKIKVIALVCVTNAMKYVETCIRIATNNKVKKVYQNLVFDHVFRDRAEGKKQFKKLQMNDV